MIYDFDKIVDRRGSGCFKYDALKMIYKRDDLLSMWVADMDFAVAPEILEALQKRLEHPVFGYNLRLESFYEAVSGWMKTQFNWRIERAWQICTPGVVPAIKLAILSLTKPNDSVLIQTPVYAPFFEAVTAHKRQLLTNALVNNNGHYEIDFGDFEAQVSQAKLFILCSPHNPVGRVWTVDELTQIGRICKKYNVPIVSDEIHADLVFEPYIHTPLATLEDFADNCITCISPAKSFNVAGLGTAVTIVSNPDLHKPISKLNFDMSLYMGNSFGIAALEAAYTRGKPWLRELMHYLKQNRDYLCDFIQTHQPELSVFSPEGTYLAWIDCRKLQLSDLVLQDLLTNRARVGLEPGTTYGVDGSGFVRLNFGCPRSILVEAMERIHYTINTM